MNDQPQPEKVKTSLEASLKKDMQVPFGCPLGALWVPFESSEANVSGHLCTDARDLAAGLQRNGYHLHLCVLLVNLMASEARRVAKQINAPEHVKLEWLKEAEQMLTAHIIQMTK